MRNFPQLCYILITFCIQEFQDYVQSTILYGPSLYQIIYVGLLQQLGNYNNTCHSYNNEYDLQQHLPIYNNTYRYYNNICHNYDTLGYYNIYDNYTPCDYYNFRYYFMTALTTIKCRIFLY